MRAALRHEINVELARWVLSFERCHGGGGDLDAHPVQWALWRGGDHAAALLFYHGLVARRSAPSGVSLGPPRLLMLTHTEWSRSSAEEARLVAAFLRLPAECGFAGTRGKQAARVGKVSPWLR